MTRREKKDLVMSLDGSKPSRNALPGKGYVSCLDGDERVTRVHGAAFDLGKGGLLRNK
jgi:hypothetical protein